MSPSFITGINIDGRNQGFSDAWDGTVDNPAMPLPTDVRYTWLTSDVGTSGDLVVDLARQWIYTPGGVPVPSDGVPYRLTDSLLTDSFHLNETDDTDAVARGLDEGDYPAFAYALAVGPTYAGTATVRSSGVPNGPPTTDPDWYSFTSTGGAVTVALSPAAGLGGRLDVYAGDPGAYSTADSPLAVAFAPGASGVTLPAGTLGAETHFVRVRHDGVGPLDWRQPYTLAITEEANTALTVAIAPRNGPFEIGAGGGTFRYTITLTNPGPLAQTTELWTDAILPNGSPYGPALRPRSVTVGAGQTVTSNYRQRVPANAPTGTYSYRANIGAFPTPEAQASFMFEKTNALSASAPVAAWETLEDDGTTPEAALLGEPRPNPFSARTVVPFTLDAEAPVSLTVYDALGRRVATLADGPLAAGTHRATFDASGLAPGPYVVRLDVGGQTVTRRVLLVR